MSNKTNEQRDWFMRGVFAAYWNVEFKEHYGLFDYWKPATPIFHQLNSLQVKALAEGWFNQETAPSKDLLPKEKKT